MCKVEPTQQFVYFIILSLYFVRPYFELRSANSYLNKASYVHVNTIKLVHTFVVVTAWFILSVLTKNSNGMYIVLKIIIQWRNYLKCMYYIIEETHRQFILTYLSHH